MHSLFKFENTQLIVYNIYMSLPDISPSQQTLRETEIAPYYHDLLLAKGHYGSLLQRPDLFKELGYNDKQERLARLVLSILAEPGELQPLDDNPYLDFNGYTTQGDQKPENATITRISSSPQATALIGEYDNYLQVLGLAGTGDIESATQNGHITGQSIFGPGDIEVARIALFQPHAKLDDVDFLVQTLIGFTEDSLLAQLSLFARIASTATDITTYQAQWLDQKHTVFAARFQPKGASESEEWVFKRLQRLSNSDQAVIPFGRMPNNIPRRIDWGFRASGTPVTVPSTCGLPNPI